MNDDIIVRIMPFPECIKGATIISPDGFYNIYINAIFSDEEQKNILRHEIQHIKNYDFDNFDTIRCIESRAKSN